MKLIKKGKKVYKNIQVILPKKSKISHENLNILLKNNWKKTNHVSFKLTSKSRKEVGFSFKIILSDGKIETFFRTEAKLIKILKENLKTTKYFIVKDKEKKLKEYKYFLKIEPNRQAHNLNISYRFLDDIMHLLYAFRNNEDVIIKIDFLKNSTQEKNKILLKEVKNIQQGKHRKGGKFKYYMDKEPYQVTDLDLKDIKALKENLREDLYNIEVSAFSNDKKILENLKNEISNAIKNVRKNNYLNIKVKRGKRDLAQNNEKTGASSFLVDIKQLSNLFYIDTDEYYDINTFNNLEIPKGYITSKKELAIGTGIQKGEELDFTIPLHKKCLHGLILGGTGGGKTWQLINQFLSDIHGDKNVGGIFFDLAGGESIEHILKRLPQERLKDVVFLDTIYPNFHFDFFGKLKVESEDGQIERIADMIKELMSKYDATLHTQIYIHPITSLLIKSGLKISNIRRIVKEGFIKKYLHLLEESEQEILSDFARGKKLSNLDPLIKRLEDIAKNKNLKKILTEKNGIAFDLPNMMSQNKIVLVSASLSLTQSVIQSIIVSAIRNATFDREKRESPFMVYIDEFSTFANSGSDIIHLLNMARKYNVSLNIAIQFLDQLGGAQKAVFGNVDSIFVLKANALDESIISRIIKSDIELDSYEALVRLGGQKTTKIKLKPLDEPLRGWEEINKILKKFEIKEEKVDNREEIKTNKNIIEEKDLI